MQWREGVDGVFFTLCLSLSECLNVVCTVLADTSTLAHLIPRVSQCGKGSQYKIDCNHLVS